MAEAEKRPLFPPTPTLETQAFWDAAAEGRFLIKRCQACGKAHYYPRAICPVCFSDKTVWEESKGEGEVYSFSVPQRGPGAPFVIAYVTLDEGPTMITNLVDCDPTAVRIGDRVKIKFQPTDGGPPVPMFTPA